MHRIVALIGPTAVGKSAVAVELAQLLGAEIISCDSMQVYRQMAVLSQAPTHGQRSQVQHHLLDCIEPTQDFSVGEYRKIAAPTIEGILSRGKRVLIVGGTGLYLKALTEGFCDAPPADVKVRERLWTECHGTSSKSLYDRLRGVDSVAAGRIHPNDARRIIRALEVYALTGKPISSWWREATAELFQGQVTVIGLTRETELLYQRINARVVHMIYEEGVINEARALLAQPLSRTARQVHGLTDIDTYLKGETSLKDTLIAWQQRVRNYARRQMIWFRQTPNLRWVTLPPEEHSWVTAERLMTMVRHPQRSSVSESPAVSV